MRDNLDNVWPQSIGRVGRRSCSRIDRDERIGANVNGAVLDPAQRATTAAVDVINLETINLEQRLRTLSGLRMRRERTRRMDRSLARISVVECVSL